MGDAGLCQQPAGKRSLQVMQGLPGSRSAGLLQAAGSGPPSSLQQRASSASYGLRSSPFQAAHKHSPVLLAWHGVALTGSTAQGCVASRVT